MTNKWFEGWNVINNAGIYQFRRNGFSTHLEKKEIIYTSIHAKNQQLKEGR